MRLIFLLKNRNFYLMLLMDLLLVSMAVFLSFFFRFDGAIPPRHLQLLYEIMPMIIPLKLAVFYACGLYYGMWRYTSLPDMRNVLTASVLSSMILLLVLFLIQKTPAVPRTVLVMDLILTFLFVSGIRVVIRIGMGMIHGKNALPFLGSSGLKRMAVLGAGHTGEAMVREMVSNPDLKMKPACLFDDSPSKWGKTVHGCPVIGDISKIAKNSKLFDEILIAIPSADGERMRRIAALCEETGKPFRIMPKMSEVMDGRVSVARTRRLRIEDLLGRKEVRLEHEIIRKSYSGKKILVSGAGGSIGSELVRQMGRFKPLEIILADFSEYNLFQIDSQARQLFPDISIKSRLVDIRDMDSLLRITQIDRPEVILHAAAYKHVPLQELNPWEAVLNNVVGTSNMVRAAIETGAEKFVLVSTDKAVRPTSVMGATKRVAEMLVECAEARSECRFAAVRFGNVLGSSGSVIPIFENQIASGMPVTITDPQVTRYFMSVSEAAQLILQAGAMAGGGEIFVLEMGKPVRILDMARDLIRLHGLVPDKDVPIVFTGLRPGEKLYEELITEGEGIMPTRHEKILVLRGKTRQGDFLEHGIKRLEHCAAKHDLTGIKLTLKDLVSEYRPWKGEEQDAFKDDDG